MESSSSSAMIDKYQVSLDASVGRTIGLVEMTLSRIEGQNCPELSARYVNRHWWLPGLPNLMVRPFESDKQHNDELPLCVCVWPAGPVDQICGDQCYPFDRTESAFTSEPISDDAPSYIWPRCFLVNGVLVSWAQDNVSDTSTELDYWESGDDSQIVVTASTSGVGARDFVVIYDGIEYRNPVPIETQPDSEQIVAGVAVPDEFVRCTFEVVSSSGDVLCVRPYRCSLPGQDSRCPYEQPPFMNLTVDEIGIEPGIDPGTFDFNGFRSEVNGRTYSLDRAYYINNGLVEGFGVFTPATAPPYNRNVYSLGVPTSNIFTGCLYIGNQWEYNLPGYPPFSSAYESGFDGDFLQDWIANIERIIKDDGNHETRIQVLGTISDKNITINTRRSAYVSIKFEASFSEDDVLDGQLSFQIPARYVSFFVPAGLPNIWNIQLFHITGGSLTVEFTEPITLAEDQSDGG